MQKEELKDQFTDLLSKFTTYFGKYLPDDVMESLKTLSSKQQSEISKIIYDVMFDDMDLAKKRNVPICQDTGVIQYFVKCGANFPLLGDLESCLREATKRATKDAPLRHNAVEIFDERNSGDNTGVRIKTTKAYPAYFGAYYELDKVQKFLDSIPNLYCVGRNGQHRYNNMDHSMLTAMEAADAIISGNTDKTALWNVNTEKEYHETK